jgi:hypothetical protein
MPRGLGGVPLYRPAEHDLEASRVCVPDITTDKGDIAITQRGLRFDTRQPSPAAIAKIRLNDIIPGVWRYSTAGILRYQPLGNVRVGWSPGARSRRNSIAT